MARAAFMFVNIFSFYQIFIDTLQILIFIDSLKTSQHASESHPSPCTTPPLPPPTIATFPKTKFKGKIKNK